ncbi:Glutaredoxin [Rhodosporidiobolus nylandii]
MAVKDIVEQKIQEGKPTTAAWIGAADGSGWSWDPQIPAARRLKVPGGEVGEQSPPESYCPYCNATKKLLKDEGIDFDVYELDQIEDGSEWQNYLAQKTGQRTVPSIFIKQQHIGGNSDLQAKHKNGQLKALL